MQKYAGRFGSHKYSLKRKHVSVFQLLHKMNLEKKNAVLNNSKHVLKAGICGLSFTPRLHLHANATEIYVVLLSCSISWLLLSASSAYQPFLLTALSSTHRERAPSAALSTQAKTSNYFCWTRIIQTSQKKKKIMLFWA